MKPRKISKISEVLKDPGTQVYAVAAGEKYLKSFSGLIEDLTKNQGRSGIVLSTFWSANALSRRLSLSKLPKGSVKIIDTVSMTLGSTQITKEDFTFLSTPVSLESVLVEIERLINIPNNDFSFFIVDSMTFLTKYYTGGEVAEFFRFILNRMLEEEIKVVIYDQTFDPGDPTSTQVSGMMDHLVTLGSGGG
ncbi:MAG: hypothetical protein ACMUIG_03490 [Thermoplasmatota archaeon]